MKLFTDDYLKPTTPAYPALAGGKGRLAATIIGMFPRHCCYVEPFGGGAAILLKKPRSTAEAVNDIGGDLINLCRRVKYHPVELGRQAVGLLHSRWQF